MNEDKWFLKSKTIIFNVVTLVVAIAVALQGIDFIPAEATKWLVTLITIGNIILRFISEQPITLSNPDSQG